MRELTVLMLLGLSTGLLLIGRWGRRNASNLAPATTSVERRRHHEQVLRRGAMACQLVGGMLVLMAIATILDATA